MKALIAFSMLSFCFVINSKAQVIPVNLITDKTSYALGEKAVLVSKATGLPANAQSEYFIKSKLDSQSLKTISVTDVFSFAITPALDHLGSYTWSVEVYEQNRISSAKLSETIEYYESLNRELVRSLEKETSAVLKSKISVQIARNTTLIQNATAQLEAGRTLVSSTSKSFDVISSKTNKVAAKSQPVLTLSVNHPDYKYNLGEQAEFRLTLTGNLEVDGDPIDVAFEGEIPAASGNPAIVLTKTVNSEHEVIFKTPALLNQDLGWREFTGRVKYKSKTQGLVVKEAVSVISSRINELLKQKKNSSDVRRRAYLDSQISDFKMGASVLSELMPEYQNLGSPLVTSIKIKDPNAVKNIDVSGVSGSLHVFEGGASDSFMIKLSSDPDGDATVTFSTGSQIQTIAPIIFNSSNWSTWKTVTVSAVDDSVVEGVQTVSISAVVVGGDYTGQAMSPINVVIEDNDFPTQFDFLTSFNSSVCGLKNGNSYCWGFNAVGENGTGSSGGYLLKPTLISLASPVSDVASGQYNHCWVRSGSVYCAGSNWNGELGNGNSGGFQNQPTPMAVLGITGATKVVGGSSTFCALKSQSVYCWGSNFYGQMGLGDNNNRLTATQVSFPESVVDIYGGAEILCARGISSKLYCTGRNDYGQLGDGTTVNKNTPILFSLYNNGINVSAISSSSNFTCVIVNSSVKCWGSLPAGSQTLTPVDVTGLETGVTQIATNLAHACAIKSGKVYCWGWNSNGQLGDGTQTNRTSPQQVSGINSGATAIVVGSAHSCALVNGRTKCWGNGPLGNGVSGSGGSNGTSLVPVDVLDPSR